VAVRLLRGGPEFGARQPEEQRLVPSRIVGENLEQPVEDLLGDPPAVTAERSGENRLGRLGRQRPDLEDRWPGTLLSGDREEDIVQELRSYGDEQPYRRMVTQRLGELRQELAVSVPSPLAGPGDGLSLVDRDEQWSRLRRDGPPLPQELTDRHLDDVRERLAGVPRGQ
jgi:hypothetical protein